MKRLSNAFNELASIENLEKAFWLAKRKKQNRKDVRAYQQNLMQNLTLTRIQLLDGTIQLGHYHKFFVYGPKKREICSVPFRERIVHQAIINVCGERFEKYQIDHSYACRKGKGSHRAIALAQNYSRHFDWYLKLDVHKYFDSVDHIALMWILERLIKDTRLLELLWKVIDSTGNDKGIPIGNLTSQYFGNIYLTMLDHYIKETLHSKGYVRYMDDFLTFGKNKTELKEKLKRIREFLSDRLKLELNTPQLNYCIRGIPFLGYRIFPQKIKLTQNAKRRFKTKIKLAFCDLDNGRISQSEFARKAETLLAFVDHATVKLPLECAL